MGEVKKYGNGRMELHWAHPVAVFLSYLSAVLSLLRFRSALRVFAIPLNITCGSVCRKGEFLGGTEKRGSLKAADKEIKYRRG